MGVTLGVLDNGRGGAASWSTFTATPGAQDGFVGGVAPAPNVTMIIHVSNAGFDTQGTGAGQGDGSSAHPYATPDHAFTIARLGSPDWILFREGDTFTSTIGFQMFGGGLDSNNFYLVSSYNPATPNTPHTAIGARPIIQYPNGVAAFAFVGSNVGIVGLNLYSYQRDPNNGAYVGDVNIAECTCIEPWDIARANFDIFEDNEISWFSGGIENALGNINSYMTRNYVHNIVAYASRPHSIGLECGGNVGINIQENFIDHCGWNPDGTGDPFSRNLYLSGAPYPFDGATNPLQKFNGNTSIRNGSGDQTRAGATDGYNNYFAHTAYGPGTPSCKVGAPVKIQYSVLQVDDTTPLPNVGLSLGVSYGGGWVGNRSAATVDHNIITDWVNNGGLSVGPSLRGGTASNNILWNCPFGMVDGVSSISNGYTGINDIIDLDTPAGTGYDGTGTCTFVPAHKYTTVAGDTYTNGGHTFTMLGTDGNAEDAAFTIGTGLPSNDDQNQFSATACVPTIAGATSGGAAAVLTRNTHGLVVGDAIQFYLIGTTGAAVTVSGSPGAAVFTTSAAHGLIVGNVVQFSLTSTGGGDHLPTGITAATNYFVIATGLTSTDFEVSATSMSGSAVTISDNGVGTFAYSAGAAPTGMSSNTTYYVIAAGLTANAFEISTTPGGSAVTITDNGGGTFGYNNFLIQASGTGPAMIEWKIGLGVLYLFNVDTVASPNAYQDVTYRFTNNGHTYLSYTTFGPGDTQMALYSKGGLPTSSGTLTGVSVPNVNFNSVNVWYQCVKMKTAGNNICHVNLVTDLSGNVVGGLVYSGIPGGGAHVEWGPSGANFTIGDTLTPFVSFGGNNASLRVSNIASVTVSGNTVNTDGITNPLNYRDPHRSAETYCRDWLGGSATIASFASVMGQNRKGNWNPLATAASLNDYIRQGFTPVGQTVIFQGSAYADLFGGGGTSDSTRSMGNRYGVYKTRPTKIPHAA